MEISLRAGREGDADVCGPICYEAFKAISDQHNFPRDFPSPEAGVGLLSQLLAREDVYSVVAEVDGRVAGSNFLWETGPISGVGPITVDPSVQNGAIGRRMMEDVMRRASEVRSVGVRLVQAAYHNRSLSLYTKLGFDAREPLSLMQGPAINEEVPGYTVRQATPGDVEDCNRLCVRVHGHDRGGEVAQAVKDGTAAVVEHGGRISGYTTSMGFFGHSVGESNEDLMALIGAAQEFAGPGFLLPTRNGELFRWCLERGLRVVIPMTLMSTGLYNEPAGAFLPSIIY